MEHIFKEEPTIKNDTAEGSPVDKVMELMDQIPKLMPELIKLSTERKRLAAILNFPSATTETTPTWLQVQETYTKISDDYFTKKQEMEETIKNLELAGHGFVVQGAREKLNLLD